MKRSPADAVFPQHPYKWQHLVFLLIIVKRADISQIEHYF